MCNNTNIEYNTSLKGNINNRYANKIMPSLI